MSLHACECTGVCRMSECVCEDVSEHVSLCRCMCVCIPTYDCVCMYVV